MIEALKIAGLAAFLLLLMVTVYAGVLVLYGAVAP